MEKKLQTKTEKQLRLGNEELRTRLTEAEEALNAIRNGETDAIVVSGVHGKKVFSLTSAETPYRIIVEEMNEGVVSLSAEGTILFCNHRFAELVSAPLEKIMGSDFIRFVAENDKPKYYDLLHAGLKERCRGEIACLIHDNNTVYFNLSFNPLPSDMLGDVCIMALDISETKQKEEELRRTQETLEQRVIERTETLTSTNEELAGSRLAAMNMMEDAVEAKDTLEIINKKLFEEIAERRQTEMELKISAEKWKTTFNSISDIICIISKDHEFIEINKAGCESLGMERKDIIGKKCFELVHHSDHPLMSCPCSLVLNTNVMQIKEVVENGGYYQLSAWPIFNEESELIAFTHSIKNITGRKQAEETLAKEQYLMNTLMDNLPEYIYFKDRESRFIRISKSLAQSFGLSDLTQTDGKTDFDFFTEEHAREAYEDELTIMRTGNPLIKEEKETWADRSDTWALTTKLPLRDKEGNIIGTFGTSIDITERKHSEEEVRRLNTDLEQRVRERTAELSDLYNNAPCGYHLLDSNGLIVRINDTELKWIGYAREEIVEKKRFSDLLTDESARIFSMNFPVFKEQGWVNDLEFDVVRKDGSFLPVLLSGTSITDSEGNYLMSRSTIIDNTERKQAEESMVESQNKLERLNRELEAFAYSVSHDLRAPLRAINGFTRILLEEYSTKIDKEGQRLCSVISENALKMGQLIDDLLAFSRLNSSAINYLNVDMKAMAAMVFNEIAEPGKKANIRFDVQELPDAFCDPVLLKQVWINLLSNAVKFTRKCEDPTIVVGFEPSKAELVYYVKDNGVGFNPEYTNKLFGVFQRLHSSDEFEGTGVGLAIVQRIINRQGGRVWAEGEIQKGATFYFTLPVKLETVN
jgi:PAS domain S-box-containing protein